MPKFSQTVFDAICDRIAQGESLRSICADADMPNHRDVTRWLDQNPDIVPQYACAREAQGDHEFDEIKDIVDAATPETVQVARLRADARRWRAGKLRPKVYGDKLDVNASGGFTIVLGDHVGKV